MQILNLAAKFWNNQFLRFLLVGGINTVFGYCMYALFTFMGLHYSIAMLLAQISGVIFNFYTTGRIVFNNSDARLFIRFFCVYITIYMVNVLLLGAFEQASYNMYIAGALLILPNALLSFFLNKILVFPKVSVSNVD